MLLPLSFRAFSINAGTGGSCVSRTFHRPAAVFALLASGFSCRWSSAKGLGASDKSWARQITALECEIRVWARQIRVWARQITAWELQIRVCERQLSV